MKRCPECRRDYLDETLLYCLDDGNALLEGPASADGPVTAILFPSDPASEAGTLAQIHLTEQTAVLPSAISEIPRTAFDKRLLAVPLLIVIVGLAVYFGYRYLGSGQGRIESIAVMPFVNDSGNAEFEYLSDGMTEILISSLSQLPDMNVKPRSSVFQYKGKDTSSQTVANELNVQAILNGRVAQRGQNVSLFIELIDIASDKVVWSQQYSRNLSDLVELQSDVARDVSNKLKIKLSGADVAKVKKDAPANPEAYQLYLKARFQLNRRTAASIKQSVDLFKQAIESDPNYAPAHSGLARAYQSFASWSLAPPREVYPKVKASAQRALELDDTLAEAHVALGSYLNSFEWDYAGAEKEYRLAIELEPADPLGHSYLCSFLGERGRFDEAIVEGRRSSELDPLSKKQFLAGTLVLARRFDEAIAELDAVRLLDPTYSDAYYTLGTAYLSKGAYQEAIGSFKKLLELDPGDPESMGYLAAAEARAGNRQEAIRILDQLNIESRERFVPGTARAYPYLALGKMDEALKHLEKDVDDRYYAVTTFSADPLLDDLRDEPRFKALLKRTNQTE